MTINMSTIGTWVLRILPAVILLQTLFFKFSAAEESVYIFSTLGMEPWGRIGSGVAELIASILLLYPRTTHLGAVIGLAVMAGALFFHLTILGISVRGDGGLLFAYALIVFICCAVLVFIHRNELSEIFKQNLRKNG